MLAGDRTSVRRAASSAAAPEGEEIPPLWAHWTRRRAISSWVEREEEEAAAPVPAEGAEGVAAGSREAAPAADRAGAPGAEGPLEPEEELGIGVLGIAAATAGRGAEPTLSCQLWSKQNRSIQLSM